MPIYEYQCKKCERVFEYIHAMSEKPPRATCEECRGKLERIVSKAAFHLKGGGWYKDGYASSSAGDSSSSTAEKSEGSKDSSAKSDKSDSKDSSSKSSTSSGKAASSDS